MVPMIFFSRASNFSWSLDPYFSRMNPNPFIKLFCMTKNTISGGIRAIKTPAMMTPQLFLN